LCHICPIHPLSLRYVKYFLAPKIEDEDAMAEDAEAAAA
jgi:hypothetical protein